MTKMQMEHFRSMVQVEWKVTFAAWTLLVALSYAAAKENIQLSNIPWAVFIIPALHIVWLILIHRSQAADKYLWVQFRRKALDELDHGSTKYDYWDGSFSIKNVIWMILEVGVTILLAIATWNLLKT